MLVISRKPGQEVNLSNGVRIVVSRVNGNRVSLAIEAPGDVSITRPDAIVQFPRDGQEAAPTAPANQPAA